jgi:HlyD family secretion protein
VIAEYGHGVLKDLTDAEQKVAEQTEDLVKADQKVEEQVLRAPVDGTVQQLAVHTIGGVVTPAQQLMMIVPLDSRLEVEAMVSNRDVGFVHPGEPAEVKVDTFNFTRYGLLHGQVVSVSQDSIIRDKPAENSGDAKHGGLAETSGPEGQELLYAARISLDRTQMKIEDKLVNLSDGMAVTAEIKTGRRRVIEYLLSPLPRYKQESLRERREMEMTMEGSAQVSRPDRLLTRYRGHQTAPLYDDKVAVMERVEEKQMAFHKVGATEATSLWPEVYDPETAIGIEYTTRDMPKNPAQMRVMIRSNKGLIFDFDVVESSTRMRADTQQPTRVHSTKYGKASEGGDVPFQNSVRKMRSYRTFWLVPSYSL